MDLSIEEKRGLFLPKIEPACGKPTIYIRGYPTEDDEPMSATEFHGRQISTLSNQLVDYFGEDSLVYVGTDSFVYYRVGEKVKWVAPDIHVVLGVPAHPLRRSFYTWAEGTAPAVVFEFLSKSTQKEDRTSKLKRYFEEIGVREYFIHQPEGSAPREFRAWRRTDAGIVEIPEDSRGARHSEALNLWFLTEDQRNGTRLLRPYLPDGTPLPTLTEAKRQAKREELWRQFAEEDAAEAEARAEAEAQARRGAEARAEAEAQARQDAEERAQQAEERAQEAETELARLRMLLAQRGGSL